MYRQKNGMLKKTDNDHDVNQYQRVKREQDFLEIKILIKLRKFPHILVRIKEND